MLLRRLCLRRLKASLLRQLSKVHGWTQEEMAVAFDEIYAELGYDSDNYGGPWRDAGVNAEMVLRFCSARLA